MMRTIIVSETEFFTRFPAVHLYWRRVSSVVSGAMFFPSTHIR